MPPFLLLARRPFVTGDIIESVGLLYLPKKYTQKKLQIAILNMKCIAKTAGNTEKKCTFRGT